MKGEFSAKQRHTEKALESLLTLETGKSISVTDESPTISTR